MEEIWKPIPGFENIYEISNLGQIRGLERVTTTNRIVDGKTQSFSWVVPQRMIKQGRRKDGYADVPLTKCGKSENYLVHRILAEVFIPNPHNFPEVNHKDGDKTNNRLDNLEWCTYKQNNTHAVYAGLNSQAIKVKCIQTGQVFPSMAQADRSFNFPLGTVSTAVKYDKKIKGYSFERI